MKARSVKVSGTHSAIRFREGVGDHADNVTLDAWQMALAQKICAFPGKPQWCDQCKGFHLLHNDETFIDLQGASPMQKADESGKSKASKRAPSLVRRI